MELKQLRRGAFIFKELRARRQYIHPWGHNDYALRVHWWFSEETGRCEYRLCSLTLVSLRGRNQHRLGSATLDLHRRYTKRNLQKLLDKEGNGSQLEYNYGVISY